MKKNTKLLTSILCLILSICMLNISLLTASAFENIEETVGSSSGTTGECTWTLDDSGVLTISGRGDTGDYYFSQYDIPWYYSRKKVKKLIVEEGVTRICSRNFSDCSNLTEVILPRSLKTIAVAAFENCSSLNTINIPDTVGLIGYAAFIGTGIWNSQKNAPVYADKCLVGYNGKAPNNTEIIVKDGTVLVANDALYSQTGITSIHLPNSIEVIDSSAFEKTAWYNNQPTGLLYIDNCLIGIKGNISESFVDIPSDTRLISGSCFYQNHSFKSIRLPKSIRNINDYAFSDCTNLTDVYFDGTIEEWNNIKADKTRNEPLFNATLHLMSDYHFSTSTGSNTIALNDEVSCAVSKTEGNIEGDLYDCQLLSWKSSNESVVKILDKKENYSQCTIKAIGYGTSKLSFYVGSAQICEATLKVGMSQEILKDNSTITMLKLAHQSGTDILNDYSVGDNFKVVGATILSGKIFSYVADDIIASFSGDTVEDNALDEITLSVMKNYFQYGDPLGTKAVNGYKESWGKFKTGMKAIKSLRKENKDSQALKVAKKTIKNTTTIKEGKIDKLVKGFSAISPYIDGAFTYYEIAATAAMLHEFDKATVESLIESFPKNSTAYVALNRLYDNMTTDEEQYIIDKFAKKSLAKALGDFFETSVFLGNKEVQEAAALAASVFSLVYDEMGGVSMDDINKARAINRFANDALKVLKNNNESSKREMLFDFCVSSIKIELDCCITVCKKTSDGLKSSAQYYQQKLKKLTYDTFIRNCVEDFNNPKDVKFENPDLEKYKISAKNASNNKALSPVGANDDDSITNENELIIPSSTEDYLVTSISENGFANLEGITTIYVPDSIEDIGDSAFYNCVDTQSITLGNKVTLIGEKAFMNCSNLSSINLNANLKTIKASVFENCSKLTSAVLGKELSELGDKSFANCESLSTVFVFNPTLVIPDAVFENCSNLTIYGYAGSTAEEYANLHNIQFESIGNSATEIKVNYNGEPTVELYGSVIIDNISLDITYSDGTTETVTDGFAVACDTSSVGKKNAVVICESAYTTFEVDVVNSVPTEISFDNQNYNMVIGDRIVPNVTLSPENADFEVVLSSNDESVVKIDGDSIVAVGEGNAEITASTVDGNLSTSCYVSVGNNQTIDCSDGLFDPVFFIAPSDGNYSFSVESDDATVTMVDSAGKVLEREEKAQNGILNFTDTLDKDEVYLLFVSSGDNKDLIINANPAASTDKTEIESLRVSLEGFEFYDSDYLENVLANSNVTIFVNDEECHNDGTGTFVGENYTVKAADYKIVEQESEYSDKPDILVTLYFNESGYSWNVPKQVEFRLEYWDFSPQYQIGDTNLDGNITISDVTEIQRHLAELIHFSDEQLTLADTNGDGKIDIGDATHLQKYLAEFDGIVLGKS